MSKSFLVLATNNRRYLNSLITFTAGPSRGRIGWWFWFRSRSWLIDKHFVFFTLRTRTTLAAAFSCETKSFCPRKAQAWAACNKLNYIWQSDISKSTKLKFYRACLESILLDGAETWTVSKELKKRLDGTCTKLLLLAQNLS